MAAQASSASPVEAQTIEALIEALDPEIRAAVDDVDRTLIALSLQARAGRPKDRMALPILIATLQERDKGKP